MPRQQFTDAPGGDSITYDLVTENGFRLCPFLPTGEEVQLNFDSVPNKKIRNDDILLNSYPKTGTNWLWEMVFMVLTRQPEVSGHDKFSSMIEASPEAAQDALPSPRIINTHLKYEYLPKEANEKKVKCILLYRNPKDTVVSFYNHTRGINLYNYDGKFENYLAMFMRGEVDYGSYPAYLLEWQQAIRENTDWPVHVLNYEDLKSNCFGEMRKLCNYLGQDVDDELLQKIVNNCDISKMRKSKEENATKEVQELIKRVMKNNFNMMRKGQIGDWKNWFTVAQSEMIDEWWARETKDLDMFTFRYT